MGSDVEYTWVRTPSSLSLPFSNEDDDESPDDVDDDDDDDEEDEDEDEDRLEKNVFGEDDVDDDPVAAPAVRRETDWFSSPWPSRPNRTLGTGRAHAVPVRRRIEAEVTHSVSTKVEEGYLWGEGAMRSSLDRSLATSAGSGIGM